MEKMENWVLVKLLVSEQAMELDNEFVFLFCEIPTLEIRSQVVYPPEPATLTASKQPCST